MILMDGAKMVENVRYYGKTYGKIFSKKYQFLT